eukprot:6710938-Prymnesium_polylepis.1
MRCAELLLRARADPNGEVDGQTETTPLMLACHYGHANCVALLLKHGAACGVWLEHKAKDEPTSPLEFALASS